MSVEQLIFDARNLVTVLSFLSFIGIVLWAYSARRGADFDAAARLPFADGNDVQDMQEADKNHG
jgi:cytochrome c oxidase cbb3-type subunit IV